MTTAVLLLVAGALFYRWSHHRLRIEELREEHRLTMEEVNALMQANVRFIEDMRAQTREQVRLWKELEDDSEPWMQ